MPFLLSRRHSPAVSMVALFRPINSFTQVRDFVYFEPIKYGIDRKQKGLGEAMAERAWANDGEGDKEG